MKIGWLRWTMGLEIDFNTAGSGSSQQRCPIIRNFIRRGHKVTICTPLTKQDEGTYDEIKSGKHDHSKDIWDCNHIKEIEYDPYGLQTDLDVLIVEFGAMNITWEDRYTGQPQMRRAIELINAHKGLVLLLQWDPDITFTFYTITQKEYDWAHPENPYRLGFKHPQADYEGRDDYGWGNFDEIFKDKEWVVLANSEDETLNDNGYVYVRSQYKFFHERGLIEYHYIPTTQTSEFIEYFYPKRKPKWTCFSTGFPRMREKAFEALFLPHCQDHKMATSGNWTRGKKKVYLDNCTDLGMHCVGFVPSYFDLYRALNKSRGVLHTGVAKARHTGAITGRYLEGIFCGCLACCDENLPAYRKYIPDEFFINEMNAGYYYDWLDELNYEERLHLWGMQYERVKHLTTSFFVDEVIRVCKKKKIKITTDKEQRRRYKHLPDEKPHELTFEVDMEIAEKALERIS